MKYAITGRMRIGSVVMSLVTGVFVVAQDLPAPKVNGKNLETARLLIELADTGLPAQIRIKAAKSELPLAMRDEQPGDAVLKTIERGPQLRQPLRLEALTGGQRVALTAAKAAAPASKGDAVVAVSALAGAGLQGQLQASYAADGSLSAELSYSGGPVDALELVIDLDGPIDTLVVGEPVAARTQAYAAREFSLPQEEGMLWGNAEADAKACGRALAGVVKRCFVGSGGHGFTFLTAADQGWAVDPKASTMTIERDKAGQVTWRIRFVNKGGKIAQQKVAFRLLTHPARMPVENRKLTWLTWNGQTKAQPADQAVINEAGAGGILLTGPAGGDAVSAAQDSIATYPTALFRYLAGTQTGLPARIQSNSVKLVNAGGSLIPDRGVLGRALANDVGVDAATLAHLGNARRLLSALQNFGFFADDGKTEFLPYWRSQRVVRYGEAFSKGNSFNLTTEDPAGRVLVSVYIRPRGGDQKGNQAIIVLLNESDQELRGRLHLLDSARLFGGTNVQTATEVVGSYDFSMAPPQSDYDRGRVLGEVPGNNKFGSALKDLEDLSIVARAESTDPKVEIYGPIHLQAHDYRILYGYAGAAPGQATPK